MGNLVNWPPTWSTLLLVPALFVGFTVHELAHALVAFLLGDTSQVEHKRLSFNPLRHVSWLGMVAFLLIGLGWAKPVWVDQTRFQIRNRAFGMFLVSIAGATANLLTALLVLVGMMGTATIVWSLTGSSPIRVLQFMIATEPGPDAQGLVVAMTYYMVMVNLLLAFFNLLPLPPLDGFQALLSLFTLIRSALGGGVGDRLASPPPEAATADEPSTQSPARIHFDIGLGYHRAGQMDEAIARYRQAIAHDEGFALAYYNQGLAYWTKGRWSLAASAFRAALQASDDVAVRIQADLRLRELAEAEQGAAGEVGPVPPPLELGDAAEVAARAAPPLDPVAVRRVWLRLGMGAVAMFTLAIMIWLYVTAFMLASVG